MVAAEDCTILSFEGESLSQLKSGVIDVTNIGIYLFILFEKIYLIKKLQHLKKCCKILHIHLEKNEGGQELNQCLYLWQVSLRIHWIIKKKKAKQK